MKRILSLNTRKILVFLLVIFVAIAGFICLIAYEKGKKGGENSPFPNYNFQASWSCCSFAWLDDTLYSLRGVWTEGVPSFGPDGYQLRKTDLRTCEDEILIDCIKGENIYLLTNKSEVYIAVMEEIYEKDMYGWEKSVLSYIDLFSLEGIKENKVLWHIEKDADTSFLGLFLSDNTLYVTTTNEILSINMKTGTETVLYTSADEIQSGNYQNALILQGKKLFFVEGNIISYIDTKTYEVKKLAEVSKIIFPQDTAVNQGYWVHNSYLYYWDEIKKATVKMHVKTGEITPVSESRFYFGQANEYGVIVCEIPKANVDKYSTVYSNELGYDSFVSKDFFYAYNSEGALDLRARYRHSLEAETAVLIGNRYFSYFDFHRQNGALGMNDIKTLPVGIKK